MSDKKLTAWSSPEDLTVVDATSAFIVADGWEKGQVASLSPEEVL